MGTVFIENKINCIILCIEKHTGIHQDQPFGCLPRMNHIQQYGHRQSLHQFAFHHEYKK